MNPPLDCSRRVALLAVCGALLPAEASAQAPSASLVFEGQTFERQMALAGSHLILNGVGLRSVAWLKGFVAGLYLSSPARTEAQVLSTSGPKRLRLRMLLDVPASEFVKALRKGVARNLGGADSAIELAAPLDQFEITMGAVGRVRNGDVIDLDLDPARGTLIVVNGTLRGDPIVGDAFYRALLRSFIGSQPYDDKLRIGLLGPLP